MIGEQAWPEIARSLRLSSRELQILRGIFDDHTEFAIAVDLGISPHTVHTHIDRIHRKLGVVDRVTLILRVMDEFLSLTVAPGSALPSICANRFAGRCPLHPRKPTAHRPPVIRHSPSPSNNLPVSVSHPSSPINH
ncbi:MAG TPA: helix-turn-helix transcriptional regulator [Verrucomicrobiae bacterium]|nr:helix-turn-helix transcriptional regulator [Verrucomicrobiae bacterium]